MKKFTFLLFAICFAFPTFAIGTLEVSVSSHTGIVPKNGVRIPFLTLHATAKNDTVQISEIRVRRTGLSQDSDIERIIAITDRYRRSTRVGINNGIATLRFRRPIAIDAEQTKKITVYGNLRITATSGRTIGLSLEGIESDAASILPLEQKVLQTPPILRRQKRVYKIVCKNRKCVRVRR